MGSNLQILLTGLQSVGKSSIMKRLTQHEFDSNIKPTLGTQIYKMILQNTQFQILDMGGQKKLRSNWYSPTLKPDGIIYVIDCAGDSQLFTEAREEFNRLIAHYTASRVLPILILGNKVDLLPEKNAYLLKEVIFEIPDGVIYEMRYCSALTGEGIDDAFKWLVGEIMKKL